MTEEEMMVLLREGAERGMLHEHESRMAGRVLELDQLTMSDVMTPRTRVVGIDVEEPHEAIWHKIVVSDHSQFPVYEGSIDNIVGIVSVKSYYANLAAGVPVNTRDLMRPAFFVPRTMTLLELINELRTRGQRLAIVLDEFGGVSGTVALRDVLASIVGDMSSDDGTKRSPFLRREDGSVLIDAIVGIDELNEYLPELGFTDVDQRGFQTLAGYICHEIGGLPQEGDHFIAHGFRFEVMDMDRLRVDKVLVQKVAPPAALP